jgi:hypothetical protein
LVKQCFVVSGRYDAVLIIAASDAETYWRWAETTLAKDPLVARFETHIVWSTLKNNLDYPSKR